VKIPTSIVILFIGAWIALQGWQLQALYDLSRQVSALDAKLTAHMKGDNATAEK
jgi:hypothetical protein